MHYNEDKLPLIPACDIISNVVDIQVMPEPLLTIISVMSSQKTLFVVILQLPFLAIKPSS